MAKTKIVTFDGHDCVGKTSLISSLVHQLSESGRSVAVLRTMTRDLDAERKRDSSLSTNVWFYLSAWLNTEKEILSMRESAEFILIDRSYYSTLVLARVLGLRFPDFLLGTLLRPDFAIWVRVAEEERRRRVREKALEADRVTIDDDLIRRADLEYSSLGLISIQNDGPLPEIARRLYQIAVP